MLMRKSKQHPQQKNKLNNSRKTDITMIYSLSMGTQKLRMLIIKRNYKNKLMTRKKKLKNRMKTKKFKKKKNMSQIIKILHLIKLILLLKKKKWIVGRNQQKKYLNYKTKLERSLDHLCNICKSFKKDLKVINYIQMIRHQSNLKKIKIKKKLLRFLL